MYKQDSIQNDRSGHLFAWGIGAFVSAFLLVFRPFELTWNGWRDPVFWLILGLAPLNAFMILGIDKLFIHLRGRASFWNNRYTSLVITLSLIITGNVLYQAVLQSNFNVVYLLSMVWRVALIALFPTVFIVLYYWRRTAPEPEKRVASRPIVFNLHDENEREALSIPADDLLYIKSDRNYVLVYTRAADQPHLLRTTLKAVEAQLKDTSVIRCHRSHLVNVQQVIHRRRLSRSLELSLRDTKEKLTVSASYIENIELHLNAA